MIVPASPHPRPRSRRLSFVSLLLIFLVITLVVFLVVGTLLASAISSSFLDSGLKDVRVNTAQYLQLRATGLISPTNMMSSRKVPMSREHATFTKMGQDVWGGLPYYSVRVWSPTGGLVWSDRDRVLVISPTSPTATTTATTTVVTTATRNPQDNDSYGYGGAQAARATAAPASTATSATVVLPVEPVDRNLLQQAIAGNVVSRLCSSDCGLPREQYIEALLNIYAPIYNSGGTQLVGVIDVAQDVSSLYLDLQARQRDLTVTILTVTIWLYFVLFLVVLATSAALGYYQGRARRRERSLRELQRQFSPAITQAILSGDDQLNMTSRLDVTVLFVDIRGFTAQAATMPAEQVVTMLNQYMAVGTRVVFRFDGVVDKFLGDGILAVFGAPSRQPDHALRAAAAALTLRRELTNLNRERASQSLPPIRVGMSLATGLVVAGNIGSAEQVSYTVIGDAVNVASRLVGLAGPGEILLTAATAGEIGERLKMEGGDAVPVRGREGSVNVYWLPEQPISHLLLDGLAQEDIAQGLLTQVA